MATPRLPGKGPVSRRLWGLVACGVLVGQAAWADPGAPRTGPDRTLGDLIAEGGEIFARQWVPDDPRSHGGDGLGPVYNETSCLACHAQGRPGGAGPASKNAALLSAPATGATVDDLEAVHPGFRVARSVVLHRYGIDPAYESWKDHLLGRENLPKRGYKGQRPPLSLLEIASGASGLKKAWDQIQEHRERAISSQDELLSNRGAVAAGRPNLRLVFSERNPPSLFGAGLIDAVPERVLKATADAQPRRVRGRLSRLKDGRVGRFGWKAQTPSLREFVFAACANELGLEIPDQHQAASPLAFEAGAKGLDLSQDECNALVAFVRFLPSPSALKPSGPEGASPIARGRKVFSSIGCADCHTPKLGDDMGSYVDGIYSDLLLHDMGLSLSDSGNYYGEDDPTSPGLAKGQEWRTPPLWAFRDSGPYLHDGRARTLQEAVAFHEGQASDSAARFFKLSAVEQFHVETFLKSLVAPGSTAAARDVERQRGEDEAAERQLSAASASAERRRREDVARAEHCASPNSGCNGPWPGIRPRRALERMGKPKGALDFYREIVRDLPDSAEGRMAAGRIAALEGRAAGGR